MKAAIYDGKELKVKEVSKPKVMENQVLIKVHAVGICGTDLAILKGDLPTPTPLILGHEFAGEVVEVGKKVTQNWLGKRVTSEINTNIDFDCYYCRKKLYTQCISRKALGIDVDGALAEFIAIDSYLLHEIPDSLSYDEATFIEPLAAAYQTFEMMPLSEEDALIAIFGLGKLGLLIVQVALSLNKDIIGIDGSNSKLNLAKKFGTQYLINRNDIQNVSSKILNITQGIGADVVIDTTGSPQVISQILASCKTRGKIHVKSTHGIEVPFNMTDFVVRELTLYSSRCGPFEKAINGLETGKINVKGLISNIYELDQVEEALKSYEKNKKCIKTIIHI